MTRDMIKSADQAYIMHTYGKLDIVPDHASGSTMWDADGKKYIDFTSGIGVNCLGWCDAGWQAAIADQAAKFQHVSNYFYCGTASALAEKLCTASGMKNVFFANSGAEANEGAIKLARKYSYDKYGENRNVIVTLKKSFHGRTITTLKATGQDHFHQYFFPFTEGFRYVEAGDVASLEAALTEDVCAVMFEFIQGEGGVNVLDSDYVKTLFELCEMRDILVITDEVQTGIGRTGKLFAYMQYGVQPDIVTSAKGLGGGLPIGAFLAGEKVAETLAPGMHGSTFGANPISCAAGSYVMDRVLAEGFLEEVNRKGEYIRNRIKNFASPHVMDVRGMGMMIGIKVDESPKDFLHKAEEAGLLVLTAGSDVVRLLPPLNISEAELEEGLSLLEKILA